MSTQLLLRRGTTAENNSFTGGAGELSVDNNTKNVRVHDGSTAGGFEIVPSGSIFPFGGASAPNAAWLLCDGSDVSRTTYARLFAVIGTAYGTGDDSSTFGLPDLRDRVPLGKGANNSTLGTETGSAAASSVITNAAANTGTGTTGTANTGTGTTGTDNTGTGTTGAGTTGAGTTGSDGDGDLTETTATFASSAKDSATATAVTGTTQAAHTHSIPGLSIPGLSIPALSVPGLSIPALSVPGLSIPALTIPALTTTLPSSVVNYIIKT